METLFLALGAVCVIVAVTALAPRVGVAAPLVLVLVGVAVSLLPFVPAVEVEPEWILGGVLPPLLYSAAVSLPAMDFRRDLSAISGLSFLLVVVTSVVLGWLLAALVPGIGLATGIAVGAILSPTDAVATSIVKQLGVSPRAVTVLEGESLLNDASALVLLRAAIAASAASVSLWGVVGGFLYAVVVAVLVGGLVGGTGLLVRSALREPSLTTAVSFVVPFAAYLPAEHLGASGLVSTVAAGIVTGVGSARRLTPQDRLSEAANWGTIGMLLEGGVFLLMGLELSGLVEVLREDGGNAGTAVLLGLVGIVAVLVVRAAFVAPLLLLLARKARRGETMRAYLSDLGKAGRRGRGRDRTAGPRREGPARSRPGQRPPGQTSPERTERLRSRITRALADIDYLAAEPLEAREGMLLVWAGMRGAVTVAAATTLPADTPQRPLLVLVAFVVAAGSLLLQGGTLRALVRWLGLEREVTTNAEAAELVGRLAEASARVVLDPDLRRPDGRPYDPAVLERVRAFARRRATGTADGGREVQREAQGAGQGAGQDPEQDSEQDTEQDTEQADLARAAAGRDLDDQAAQTRDLRIALIEAQRDELLRIRALGTASSQVLTRMLQVLDADQLSVELRSPGGSAS